MQNASNTYSEFNTVKFDLEDEEDRYTLYNAFVAWVTNSSSIVPESDFMYNETRQELPNRNTYFADSDEHVYIDIRRSKGYTSEFERVNRDDSDSSITIDPKAAAAKKMRLRMTGYFQGEYMYMLGKDGLMNYKGYGVNKQKADRIVSDAHKTIRQEKKNKLFWFWEKDVKKRDITNNKMTFFFIIGIKPLRTQQKTNK